MLAYRLPNIHVLVLACRSTAYCFPLPTYYLCSCTAKTRVRIQLFKKFPPKWGFEFNFSKVSRQLSAISLPLTKPISTSSYVGVWMQRYGGRKEVWREEDFGGRRMKHEEASKHASAIGNRHSRFIRPVLSTDRNQIQGIRWWSSSIYRRHAMHWH